MVCHTLKHIQDWSTSLYLHAMTRVQPPPYHPWGSPRPPSSNRSPRVPMPLPATVHTAVPRTLWKKSSRCCLSSAQNPLLGFHLPQCKNQSLIIAWTAPDTHCSLLAPPGLQPHWLPVHPRDTKRVLIVRPLCLLLSLLWTPSSPRLYPEDSAELWAMSTRTFPTKLCHMPPAFRHHGPNLYT